MITLQVLILAIIAGYCALHYIRNEQRHKELRDFVKNATFKSVSEQQSVGRTNRSKFVAVAVPDGMNEKVFEYRIPLVPMQTVAGNAIISCTKEEYLVFCAVLNHDEKYSCHHNPVSNDMWVTIEGFETLFKHFKFKRINDYDEKDRED